MTESEHVEIADAVTDLPGVYAGAIASGIKPKPRNDLAFLFVPDAVGSAAVYTRNAFAAAPILVTRRALARSVVKAVIINAGNANAATGKEGIRAAEATQK